MATSVCTLFEKHYHFGLAAFVNSLFKKGFKGNVYAGYRGELPDWASSALKNEGLAWKGASTIQLGDGVKLHFLPLETDFHFANYKPTFMLQLMHSIASNDDAIAYFDPDIVLKCNWNFFETWMSHGVAMVHEISSNDMPPNHPIRREWEKVIDLNKRKTVRQLYSYINSGFCGVRRENIEFIKVWEEMIKSGLEYFNHAPDNFVFTSDRTDPFYANDQDAFNIAAMCCETPLSEMGPEAMDFVNGGQIMSHAISTPKPWIKNYLTSAIKGHSVSMTEKEYWKNVDGPLTPFSKSYLWKKRKSMLLTSIISRFNKR